MRTLIAITLMAVLGAAGCSKPTQDKTAQDLKAVGSEAGSAAKQVANSPAGKALGSDIKQGASEAAAKTKEAAGQAGEKLKTGADKAGSDLKSGANKAGNDLKSGADNAKNKAEKH